MPSGAPDDRQTHVTRIFGTNKAGERLTDVWIDVERIDAIKGATQLPDRQWQGYQRRFRWCDDPNADDYNPDGTPSRDMEIIKVCDPAGNVDDPDEWVPVKVIRSLRARAEGGAEANGVGAQERFLTRPDDADNSRTVEVRRVVHYDTNVDDLIQAEADANPSLIEYVVSASEYEKDAGSKDDAQAVEVEISTYFKSSGNADDVSGIGRQGKLLNQYLIDSSEDPKGDAIGMNGFNPPYRLDPFQNIINCQLGGLAVEFFDGAT